MRSFLALLLALSLHLTGQSSVPQAPALAKFDTVNWTADLRAGPRLLLTPERLDRMRQRLASDPEYAGYYADLRRSAVALLDQPVLSRAMTGRRLLSVSREALRRTTTLALVYRIEADVRYLERLDRELAALTAFTDWNPGHFLDVAEMATAVALALDWCGGDLPPQSREAAYAALYTHGLAASFARDYWWITSDHNWNQVCHGGTVAAALVLAERHPELAGRAIDRALRHIPLALRAYAPDGAYPEGPGYWAYGTAYTVLTIEMLRSALGTDFGMSTYPGLPESGLFRRLTESPSGLSFNYGDNRAASTSGAAELLAWFAGETDQPALYRPARLTEVFRPAGRISRIAPLALIWLPAPPATGDRELPTAWFGRGPNPIFTLRDARDTTFFLAGKGGRGSINHGNLDAGSFVFDLDGVRWAHDLGSQSYHQLEQIGFRLWGKSQQADRWKLISKNNHNHNTLTVDDSLHRVDGYATVRRIDDSTFRVGLTAIFAGQLEDAVRDFRREGPRSVRITDRFTLLDTTRTVSWRMLTRAAVTLTEDGALLEQDGQALRLIVDQPTGLRFSVVQLDPPPLPYDIRIQGLKRLQLDVPAYYFGDSPTVEVRLEGR